MKHIACAIFVRNPQNPQPDLHGEATFHFFTVIEWTGGEPEMLGNEHTHIGWFTIEEACSLETLALVEYRDLFRNLILSA